MALLSVRYDGGAKVNAGDYPSTLDVSSSESWAEQAEEQLMSMEGGVRQDKTRDNYKLQKTLRT